MIGILVQLLVSWLLIRLVEKKNLSVLGFAPTKERVVDFIIFFMVTAAICSSDFFLKMLIANQRWQLNPNLNWKLIAEGVWWNIKSVFFEELIFRGVLLYILLKRIGLVKAVLISAAAFGMYHWFTQGSWGQPVPMLITFIVTGAMGCVYAYGYCKTVSLYVPAAIHLGWNLTQSVVFSNTVIGNQLFVQVKPIPVVTISYVEYFILLLVPMVSALLINFLLIRRKRQVV